MSYLSILTFFAAACLLFAVFFHDGGVFGRAQAVLLGSDKRGHMRGGILLEGGIDLLFCVQERGKGDIEQFMGEGKGAFLQPVRIDQLIDNSQNISFFWSEAVAE
jgi:hypothetical protein